MQRMAMALDPLLATLANFSSPSHLSSQIALLFQLMDVDDSGTLSFHEMQQGMEALPLHPRVVLSIEDWESLTLNGSVLDEHKCMNKASFFTAIRWQLMLYGQRLLAQRMSQAIKTNSDDPTSLFAMKLCLMQVCGTSIGIDGGGPSDTSFTNLAACADPGGGGGGGEGGGGGGGGDKENLTSTSRTLFAGCSPKPPLEMAHARAGAQDEMSAQLAAMARRIEEGHRRTDMALRVRGRERERGRGRGRAGVCVCVCVCVYPCPAPAL